MSLVESLSLKERLRILEAQNRIQSDQIARLEDQMRKLTSNLNVISSQPAVAPWATGPWPGAL